MKHCMLLVGIFVVLAVALTNGLPIEEIEGLINEDYIDVINGRALPSPVRKTFFFFF